MIIAMPNDNNNNVEGDGTPVDQKPKKPVLV